MSVSDLKSAAERAALRRKLMKTPVPMRPDDPENIRISKADFIAKRRKQKEEEVAVEEFKRSRNAKLTQPKEESDGQEVKEEKKVLRGRPKKVE